LLFTKNKICYHIYPMDDAICNHKNFGRVARLDTLSLLRCDECAVVFTDRRMDDFDPEGLYVDYYKNEMAGRFNLGIECLVRLFRFFRAFKIFTVSPRAKTILDVGSGRGFLLYYLKKYYGYARAAGSQVSKNAIEFSRNTLGLEIYDKDLLELSLGQSAFDVITIWHVLEHVREPEKYIVQMENLLKADGKLVIEVPNFDSWTRGLTGKYWLGLDLDYHIYFFTPKSLCGLLEKHGFKIVSLHTFSLEYSTFISTQSLVSLLTKSGHLFFKFLQGDKIGWWLAPHLLLFMALAPICFLINIFLYFSKRGEVVLVVAEKNKE